jgi:hypothetical protein
MESMKTASHNQEARCERANLDGRYGKIGISAVAAAVRYQSDSEVPAPAYRRFVETDD